MKATTITVSNELETLKEGLDELLEIIKEVIDGIKDKEGLKVIVSTDMNCKNRVHHHILINRKLDIDITEKWKYGQSYIHHWETTDQYQMAIRYVCSNYQDIRP